MKIRDAKPGDVLQDRDGALWLRGQRFARCIYDPANKSDVGDNLAPDSGPHDMDRADRFGPFARLVPEREGE